jgi:hypothetical protein
MRITPALALPVLLGCGPLLADTVYYRCVEAERQQINPTAILLVTIDPLLGEIKADRYSGKTLRSRTTYQIDVLDEVTIRGRMLCRYSELSCYWSLTALNGESRRPSAAKSPLTITASPLRRSYSQEV